MASIKDLKKRITSVKNTQQTTRAMKMVSAAKLRRAQEAILSQRPYAKRIDSLIRLLTSAPDLKITSPLIRSDVREIQREEGVAPRVLLVILTSDRGLCGGFNSNIIKAAQRWLKTSAGNYSSIELAFVGRRGYDFFKTRRVKMGRYFSELSGKVSFQKARTLSDALVERYLSGEVDEVKLIYNEFKNAVSQKVQVENLLPLQGAGSTTESVEGAQSQETPLLLIKPNPKEVLEALLSKHFATQAFRIMLESQASEHGARMSAMENATKNASEMIRKLTLEYNKQRQANITKELLEIISGSESQKVNA